MVLADGAQAAFAAGAVAELVRHGRRWMELRGAGLGAQVAVLAALGESEEAERRWSRQAEAGCPLLATLLAAARERVGELAGVLVLPDAYALAGWLDQRALAEHLAPELAGLPARLQRAGAHCAVAVDDLAAGTTEWVELATAAGASAAAALGAAARFAGGWGPAEASGEDGGALRWGGVAAAARTLGELAGWDVVCGFPVPPVVRPALGGSFLELVQRRDEIAAGAAVAGSSSSARVVAPSQATWAEFAARDGAELGVEYPLPWERNGELTRAAVEYGRFVALRPVS